MKIAKVDGLMVHNTKKMLHKAKLGLASLAIAGGLASCVPAVAQNTQTDNVEIKNAIETTTKKTEPNWKKAAMILGGTFLAAGILRWLLGAEIPGDKEISELSDFERESLHDYLDR